MTEKIAFHYDCDPGQDDAVALLYALGSGILMVESISVVGGNTDVGQCARNALQILELAQRPDIPVYCGAAKPLARALETLPHVFGITGMAGAEDLPQPTLKAIPINAATDLSSLVKSRTIIATGPLTNLALQLQTNPQFAKQIDHLVIMGGCVYPEPVHQKIGNFTPKGADDVAEYNFACDPDAAKIVFASGIENITLVGLNITRAVLYGIEIDRALRAINKKCALKTAEILSVIGEEDALDYLDLRTTPDDPVRAIHDVLAMACAENPALFEFEYLPIRIVNDAAPAAAGQTLIDHIHYDHPHVKVAVKVDAKGFWQFMLRNIEALP